MCKIWSTSTVNSQKMMIQRRTILSIRITGISPWILFTFLFIHQFKKKNHYHTTDFCPFSVVTKIYWWLLFYKLMHRAKLSNSYFHIVNVVEHPWDKTVPVIIYGLTIIKSHFLTRNHFSFPVLKLKEMAHPSLNPERWFGFETVWALFCQLFVQQNLHKFT